jgi:hypothetical protein
MSDLAGDHGDGHHGPDNRRGSSSEDSAVKAPDEEGSGRSPHRARLATSAALTAGHSSAMTLKNAESRREPSGMIV